MALTQAGIKARIKNALDATYGAPADAAEQEKFCSAFATALLEILTTDAAVSGSATGVEPGPGTAPVTGTIS